MGPCLRWSALSLWPITLGGGREPFGNAGVAAAYAALRVGGTLAVWSAWDDLKFERRLRFHGFVAQVERVRARLKKGGRWHTIFVGLKDAHRAKGRVASRSR